VHRAGGRPSDAVGRGGIALDAGATLAIRNQKVIIAPNSPSAGVLVAFIEVNGAPVELMQIDHLLRKDL
jgi:hypothetical protein